MNGFFYFRRRRWETAQKVWEYWRINVTWLPLSLIWEMIICSAMKKGLMHPKSQKSLFRNFEPKRIWQLTAVRFSTVFNRYCLLWKSCKQPQTLTNFSCFTGGQKSICWKVVGYKYRRLGRPAGVEHVDYMNLRATKERVNHLYWSSKTYPKWTKKFPKAIFKCMLLKMRKWDRPKLTAAVAYGF